MTKNKWGNEEPMNEPPMGIIDHLGAWVFLAIACVLMIVSLFQPITDKWVIIGIFSCLWLAFVYHNWA